MRTLLLLLTFGLLACGGEERPVKPPARAGRGPPPDTRPLFRGRVVTKGDEKPVAGAEVVVRLTFGAGAAGHRGLRTTTDAEGRFSVDLEGELHPVTDSPVLLEISRPGFVRRQWSLPSYAPGRGRSVVAELEPAGTVTGSVRDARDGPVAKAMVYAIRADVPGVRLPVEVIHTFTREDGSFCLPGLPGGKIDIGAKAKGYVPSLVPDVEVRVRRETPIPALVLQPGKSIAGRAVLKGGTEPVRRAVIRVFRDPALKDFALFGRSGIANAGGIAKVDAEGRFEVTGLRDGTYDVDAVTLGLVGSPGGAEGVKAGTRDLTLVFVRSAKVVLRVVDRDTRERIRRFSLTVQCLTGPKDPEGRPVVREEIDVRSPIGEYSFPARADDLYGVEILVKGYEIERRTIGPLRGGRPEVTTVFLKRRE